MNPVPQLTPAEFDPHDALLAWYSQHQRALPWRTHPSPYRTLISEIMLQQTQVDRVIPYFERFVASFPDFAALANAPRAQVIQHWAGLGYNRRAVHLHELAIRVVEQHGGELPADAGALRALPGIGPYTTGAILSIAFGQDEPALDTNVRRVVRRYAAPPDATELERTARKLVPAGRAGDWNQALMDLGSSLCTSRRPRCLLCPLQPGCHGAGDAAGPPVVRVKPQGTFAGSNRYYRGRLLAQLRTLPPGTTAPIRTLAQQLAQAGVAEPPAGWRMVGEALARDGLARLAPLESGSDSAPPGAGDDGVTVGLA